MHGMARDTNGIPSRRPVPGRVGSSPGPFDPKTHLGNSPASPPIVSPARSSVPAPLDEFTLNSDQGLVFYDELGRRVQPPDAGGGEGRYKRGMQLHGVPRGPQRRLPGGAEGGVWEFPYRECRV